jgi:hypothetical protein
MEVGKGVLTRGGASAAVHVPAAWSSLLGRWGGGTTGEGYHR